MRAAAVILAAAALGASAAPAATPTPTLRVVQTKPFVVSGSHFRPLERVTVTVRTLGMRQRTVIARGGAFRVDFGILPVSRCTGRFVAAVGSRGSRVELRIPRPMCLPVPSPAGSTG